MMHQHGDVPALQQYSPFGPPAKREAVVPAAAPAREPEPDTRAEFDGVGITWRAVRRSGDSLKATFLGYCSEPMN